MHTEAESRAAVAAVDACDEAARAVRQSTTRWHVITCEYPPQVGGVSDYTRLVAENLAKAGDEVHVWSPSQGEAPAIAGVTVHNILGRIGAADLWRLGKQLNRFAESPRRLLVQWVPHGYGFRSMNIAFCGWLWARAHLRGDRLEVMIHEPYLAFGEGSLRQDVVAMVHRVMAVILLHSASKIWVSIPAWDAYCRPYLIRRRTPIEWLPIPSSIEISSDSTPIEGIRRRYLGKSRFLLGHFGIHGSLTTQALRRILAPVLDRCPTATMLFIGKGSEEFRDKVLSEWPRFLGRVEAAGMLAPAELSQTLSACDLMLQPYPDGVSSRRTSAMAALVHGIPMLTTTGHLSEDFWEHSGAVATVPAGDSPAFVEATLQLLEDTEKRSAIGSRASKLYRETFDINHVTGKLRRTSAVD